MQIKIEEEFLEMTYTVGHTNCLVVGSGGMYTLEELKSAHDALGRMIEQMEHDQWSREYDEEQKSMSLKEVQEKYFPNNPELLETEHTQKQLNDLRQHWKKNSTPKTSLF